MVKTIYAINNHNGDKIAIGGAFVLASGKLAAILDSNMYCLNELYEKDGEIHLSQWSIGGTMLGDNVEHYNEGCYFDSQKIVSEITDETAIKNLLGRMK